MGRLAQSLWEAVFHYTKRPFQFRLLALREMSTPWRAVLLVLVTGCTQVNVQTAPTTLPAESSLPSSTAATSDTQPAVATTTTRPEPAPEPTPETTTLPASSPSENDVVIDELERNNIANVLQDKYPGITLSQQLTPEVLTTASAETCRWTTEPGMTIHEMNRRIVELGTNGKYPNLDVYVDLNLLVLAMACADAYSALPPG